MPASWLHDCIYRKFYLLCPLLSAACRKDGSKHTVITQGPGPSAAHVIHACYPLHDGQLTSSLTPRIFAERTPRITRLFIQKSKYSYISQRARKTTDCRIGWFGISHAFRCFCWDPGLRLKNISSFAALNERKAIWKLAETSQCHTDYCTWSLKSPRTKMHMLFPNWGVFGLASSDQTRTKHFL